MPGVRLVSKTTLSWPVGQVRAPPGHVRGCDVNVPYRCIDFGHSVGRRGKVGKWDPGGHEEIENGDPGGQAHLENLEPGGHAK